MKYEFTITLRPRLYKYSPSLQYRMTKSLLAGIMLHYQASCVAELTGENNIHYHCMIELKDHKHRDSLLDKFRQYNDTFGRKSCTQLMNEPKWREYMIKDYQTTFDIIGDTPVVQDTFEVADHLYKNYIDKILCLKDQ